MAHLRTGCEDEKDIEYLKTLDKRLEKNPDDVQALIEKGFLFITPFYREQEGIDLLEKAVNIDPNNIDAYFWLAMGLYQGLCNSKQAKKILRKALKINPHNADCLTLLANLEKNSSESIFLLEQAIKEKPDLLFSRIQLASYLLNNNKIEEAEKEINEALKIYKNITFQKHKKPIENYYKNFAGHYPEFKEEIDNFFLKIEAKRKELGEVQKNKS